MEKALEEWIDWHKGQISSFHTKDLATYLGVSPRTIQRWIREKTKPSKGQLAQINRYLKESEPKEPEASL